MILVLLLILATSVLGGKLPPYSAATCSFSCWTGSEDCCKYAEQPLFATSSSDSELRLVGVCVRAFGSL